MTDFREIMGPAFSASDLSPHEWETTLDRIAALGFASRLGTLLWRLKFGNDSAAYAPALELLVKRTQARPGRDPGALMRRLCKLVLREWLMPGCGTCLGARELILGERRVVCDDCGGSGVRRYSDRDRERAMQISRGKWSAWVVRYERTMAIVTAEEISVNRELNKQLERGNAEKS